MTFQVFSEFTNSFYPRELAVQLCDQFTWAQDESGKYDIDFSICN